MGTTDQGAPDLTKYMEEFRRGSDSVEISKEVLRGLRERDKLCDAKIILDNCEFKVHSAIMSRSSMYFRSLFTTSLGPSKLLSIPGLPAHIMQILIDFAYTGEADVSYKNIENVYKIADRFYFFDLLKLCDNYLEKYINPRNCIGISTFARMHFNHKLYHMAKSYTMYHCEDVFIYSSEFADLKTQKLYEMLSSDELNVSREVVVFQAILRWINHDFDKRKSLMPRLLETVRMGTMTKRDFIVNIKQNPIVSENESCQPLIQKVSEFLDSLIEDTDEKDPIDYDSPLAKPRMPHEVMFAIGGWSGGHQCVTIETYDTRADKWTVCKNGQLEQARAYHGTVSMDGFIYVIGGFDCAEYYSSVRKFDPITYTWTEVAPMNSKRGYLAVTTLDGFIYALGGNDGQIRLCSAEKFQPTTNQWTLISPMRHQRSDPSATTIRGHIFICGGFDGEECQSSAERYNPKTNQWTLLSSMRNARCGLGVVAYNDAIYAICGFNGNVRLKNMEIYNIYTDEWRSGSELYEQRSNFAFAVIDDLIYVAGGYNGQLIISDAECYDFSTNEWSLVSKMSAERSALSTCVLSELKYMRGYLSTDYPTDNLGLLFCT